MAAINAPVMATPPATRHPPAKLCKNAAVAVSESSRAECPRPSLASVWEAMIAPPIELFAGPRARAGKPAGTVDASWLPYLSLIHI